MSAVEMLFGGTLALGCVLAMVSDARRRMIPNLLCGLLLLVGLAYGFWQEGLAGLGWHAAHAGVALLIGMTLFAIRWFGGGDGKFYAACAAWFPLQKGFLLGFWIALAALALVFVWFTVRKLQGKPTFTLREGKSAQLPFGIPLGVGTLITYAMQLPI
ncbi:prepilin peptidase CpaA [Novosphingobium kunmingense]|uniref:Prepilin peptidase CpaA n=1 Tax=Novosphingobium kunmingense TaxID=1211806 RepID=A0A2N0H6F2_9SPHN|nr:prepilin peptidase [Novosphingobium kunmingense]PKB14525.1 prepilin peptidase CpaA [Novosphingobium kunmingense]